MNNFWAAGLALVHKHLPHHSQGHHAFLTLLHCKLFDRHYQGTSCCAPLSQWWWVAQNCWNRLSPLLCLKYLSLCHTEHGSPSRCVWNTTVHMKIHMMYSNCHQMVVWSEVKWGEGRFNDNNLSLNFLKYTLYIKLFQIVIDLN